jgi:uncharacterized membrane protein YfcA
MTESLILGLLVGTVLGLVGGGGSIIAVPALMFGLGLPMTEAIPASLVVVGSSSLVAMLPRIRAGVDWHVAPVTATAGIPAAIAGAALNPLLDPTVLILSFAVVMFVAGIRMITSPRNTASPPPARDNPARRWVCAAAIGLGVGFLTGLLGVGGGFLITPALVLLLRMPMARAAGTSLAVIVVNSVAALLGHAGNLNIDWNAIGPFAVAALLCSIICAKLAGRISDSYLRIGFAALVLGVAAVTSASALYRNFLI